GDDLAALHALDHAPGDLAALRVERVGVAGRLDELVLGAVRDLDDLGVDRRQPFHLGLVVRAGRAVGRSRRCDDLELCHADLLSRRAIAPETSRLGASASRQEPSEPVQSYTAPTLSTGLATDPPVEA